MSHVLTKIKKIHFPLTPPANATAYGVTPDGKHQLYRLVLKRSRSVPDIDPKTGESKFRKNQMTGEPLIQLRKSERYDEERIFWLESDGQGNVNQVPYSPPSEAELAKIARAQRVKDTLGKLAEAMVDSDVEPSVLLASLKAQGTTTTAAPGFVVPTVTTDAETTTGEFPTMYAPGRWKLSNGLTMQGKKAEAVEAEEAIAAAKKVAAETPEE